MYIDERMVFAKNEKELETLIQTNSKNIHILTVFIWVSRIGKRNLASKICHVNNKKWEK